MRSRHATATSYNLNSDHSHRETAAVETQRDPVTPITHRPPSGPRGPVLQPRVQPDPAHQTPDGNEHVDATALSVGLLRRARAERAAAPVVGEARGARLVVGERGLRVQRVKEAVDDLERGRVLPAARVDVDDVAQNAVRLDEIPMRRGVRRRLDVHDEEQSSGFDTLAVMMINPLVSVLVVFAAQRVRVCTAVMQSWKIHVTPIGQS